MDARHEPSFAQLLIEAFRVEKIFVISDRRTTLFFMANQNLSRRRLDPPRCTALDVFEDGHGAKVLDPSLFEGPASQFG